ncbi:AAA family ATPase [Mucilaginibacter calamicampi]|uniref:AAA family ATPase n=1 Tax=Mucilaginibacter calamicampi TaxID=1302352 RepID=A0ABW2YRG3_9SPHI
MNYDQLTNHRPAEIELIRDMARGALSAKQKKKMEQEIERPPDTREAFIIKPASQWLQSDEQPHDNQCLFGDFWYRDELCILFADTNVGKSILAVQIGDALSKGEPLLHPFETPPQAQKVLYFDFELSAQQFEKRYSTRHSRYVFSDNFYRLVFNPHATGQKRFNSYAEYMNNAIENVLVSTGARTLIIDNITCLRTGTEATAGAVSLMRNLQTIKQKYGLSILVLAHTPKRNPARPITRNDLQGSKMLINFADSAFAIGESQTQAGLRYLKQIKQRSGQQLYGTANVCLFRVVKPLNFLKMEFIDNAAEAAHLMAYTEQHRRDTERHIQLLHSQGRSIRFIADEMGVSRMAVHRVVKRLGEEM